jgi:Fur family ferric uptake transcriptional regulator
MGPKTQLQPDFRRLLVASGIRPTQQRLHVVEALAAEPNDATAQQIHLRLHDQGHDIGLATVYRTLSVLCEYGFVHTLMHHPGEACYRLCGAGDHHHHHLVCTECHRVVELGGCNLDGWLAQLGTEHGFTVTGHSVEVAGLCADCAPPS